MPLKRQVQAALPDRRALEEVWKQAEFRLSGQSGCCLESTALGWGGGGGRY